MIGSCLRIWVAFSGYFNAGVSRQIHDNYYYYYFFAAIYLYRIMC